MRAVSVRKLLIWLICLLISSQSGLSVTPAEIDANDQDAKLRAMIEAAPELPFKQTELAIKLWFKCCANLTSFTSAKERNNETKTQKSAPV
jgi:hypothetical protein